MSAMEDLDSFKEAFDLHDDQGSGIPLHSPPGAPAFPIPLNPFITTAHGPRLLPLPSSSLDGSSPLTSMVLFLSGTIKTSQLGPVMRALGQHVSEEHLEEVLCRTVAFFNRKSHSTSPDARVSYNYCLYST